MTESDLAEYEEKFAAVDRAFEALQYDREHIVEMSQDSYGIQELRMSVATLLSEVQALHDAVLAPRKAIDAQTWPNTRLAERKRSSSRQSAWCPGPQKSAPHDRPALRSGAPASTERRFNSAIPLPFVAST